jgi:hypothetical protein
VKKLSIILAQTFQLSDSVVTSCRSCREKQEGSFGAIFYHFFVVEAPAPHFRVQTGIYFRTKKIPNFKSHSFPVCQTARDIQRCTFLSSPRDVPHRRSFTVGKMMETI